MGGWHFILASFCLSSVGLACTVCNSETGIQVRAGIFNPTWTTNFIASLSPFIIFFLIALVVHFGWFTGAPKGIAHER